MSKQMEFAREIMPGASKIGLLTNLSDPKAPPQAQELLAAGRGPEVEVTSSDANRPEETGHIRAGNRTNGRSCSSRTCDDDAAPY